MATLTVGAGEEFPTISAAVAASQTGDTILVPAGTYTNDFASIFHDLTIKGVGGMVSVVATEPPPDLKAIFTVGAPGVHLEIDNLAFSGAAVSSDDGGNGAGIRYQGGSLVLNSDYFFGNQEGMLAATDPNGSITINDSEFSNNGVSDPGNTSGYGLTHNLYVNEVGTLTIENSLFTAANVGHEIKSRALNTIIENNRIQDGPNGTASYEIDLPNGGNALIENNTIEKGPQSQNPVMVTSGEEGNVYAGSSLTVQGNTFVNDLGPSATAVRNETSITADIANNSFYGIGSANIAAGPASVMGTTILTTEPTLDYSPPSSLCSCTGTISTGTGTPGNTGTISTGPIGSTGTISDSNGHAVLIADVQVNGTLIAHGASDTMIGGSGNSVFFELGGGNDSIVGGGNDTIVGTFGDDTIVSAAAKASLIAPGIGNDLILANGADVVFPGAGSDTVFAFGPVLVGAGAGVLFFINGANPSTIIGGNTGNEVVNAGAGGGLYGAGGGGGSVLVAGTGAATLVGAANNDVLFAGGNAADLLIAGNGNETLSGLGSSGANAFYAGSGADLLGAGAGSEMFFAGTGNDTMIAGSGADLFAFANGGAGGTDVIESFNAAAGSRITLQNYGSDAVQTALNTATVAGGSTTIALPDHTTITFTGVTNLTSAAFA